MNISLANLTNSVKFLTISKEAVMNLHKATITSKGQVTIPKEIRKFLSLSPGDEIDFIIGNEGEVRITPKTSDIRALKGLLHKPGQPKVTIDQMNKTIKKRVKKKFQS